MKHQGIAIYAGVVFGKAYLYEPFDTEKAFYPADELGGAQARIAAYGNAAAAAIAELDRIIERIDEQDADKAAILHAQQELICDVSVEEEIHRLIEDGASVSQAIREAFEQFIRMFAGAENEFTQERVMDLQDVRNRILRCLAGQTERSLAKLEKPVVVFAKELLPSDTATLDRENVQAIVAERGGLTSHTAIIARSYRIPTVLSVENVLQQVAAGDEVIVDALDGSVIVRPGDNEREALMRKREAHARSKNETMRYHGIQAATSDGLRIGVHLNIGSDEPLPREDVAAVDGVGLFRSEFLYMKSESTLPDEERQFQAYRSVVERFSKKPIVLRTLDIGGDKQLPCLELPNEENPFLGKRALRLCFDEETLFHTQLRAALRASAYGDLRIMFPMVGSMDDIRRANACVKAVKAELRSENIAFNPNVMLGIMIEIPSIALLADVAVQEIDFASIGTNDLCQYLMAADRMNPSVTAYYQDFHPAMFRLIGYVAKTFAQAQKPLCVCGELAGDPRAALLFVGLGIRSLSMSASSIARVKQMLSSVSLAEAEAIAGKVCGMPTADQIKRELNETMDTFQH